MTLSPCPNCSGYVDDPGKWLIRRPQLATGRRSKKVFVLGCCSFSNRSTRVYESEEEASAAWERYRVRASEGDPRREAMLMRLNTLGIPHTQG